MSTIRNKPNKIKLKNTEDLRRAREKHRFNILSSDNGWYIEHPKTSERVCKVKEIGEKSYHNQFGTFVWCDVPEENKSQNHVITNDYGHLFMNIRTGDTINLKQPPYLYDEEKNIFNAVGSYPVKVTQKGLTYVRDQDNQNNDEKSNEADKQQKIDKIYEEKLKDVDLKFGYTKNVDYIQPNNFKFVELFEEFGDGEIGDENFEPPTLERFVNRTISKFERADVPKIHSHKNQWKNRLRTMWPSLVRESHFATSIRDMDVDEVIYSKSADVEKGADAVVMNDDTEYHVNLFTDTSFAWKNLSSKKDKDNTNRHVKESINENGSNPRDVYIPIDIFNDRERDIKKEIETNNDKNIFLYSEKHKEALKKIVNENKQAVHDENGDLIAYCASPSDDFEQIREKF